MIIEIIKFLFYSFLIIIISKNILVVLLRKLAENLNLKPRTVGNIAGYATSMPEFLTITVSSLSGLVSASIYNILSSNIINLIQYIGAILLNKNHKTLKNRALKMDLILVLVTIIIPIVLIFYNVKLSITIIPMFIILFALCTFLNNNVHKLYLKSQNKEINEKIEKEESLKSNSKRKTILYIVLLIVTGILLFFVGDALSDNLESLCNRFNISQVIIGVLLGFITSIPELITFFESQNYHNKKEDGTIGVVEATNNLLTSNMLNLYIIQSVGILILTII